VFCRHQANSVFSRFVCCNSDIKSFKWKWTCQCKMMLHTNPRVSFGLPSTMSLLLMFTNFTLFCSSICSALLTLFKWCTLIRPLSLLYCFPVSNSRSDNRRSPSCRSTNKSVTGDWEVFSSCELIHLAKVFFCTSSRSFCQLSATICMASCNCCLVGGGDDTAISLLWIVTWCNM